MYHHHFHHVVLEKGIAMLNGMKIEANEHLAVMFEDGHVIHGRVVTQCCQNDAAPKMFVPVEFHGKQPWILLQGMKAHRL